MNIIEIIGSIMILLTGVLTVVAFVVVSVRMYKILKSEKKAKQTNAEIKFEVNMNAKAKKIPEVETTEETKFIIEKYDVLGAESCEICEAEKDVNVSLKTTEDDLNEKNNIIDDVIIYCTFLPEYLKMLEYYKEEPFFKMQNTGANPCEIEKPIQINRSFGNEQMYM